MLATLKTKVNAGKNKINSAKEASMGLEPTTSCNLL